MTCAQAAGPVAPPSAPTQVSARKYAPCALSTFAPWAVSAAVTLPMAPHRSSGGSSAGQSRWSVENPSSGKPSPGAYGVRMPCRDSMTTFSVTSGAADQPPAGGV